MRMATISLLGWFSLAAARGLQAAYCQDVHFSLRFCVLLLAPHAHEPSPAAMTRQLALHLLLV
jgi:hypothetical protein